MIVYVFHFSRMSRRVWCIIVIFNFIIIIINKIVYTTPTLYVLEK